VVAVFSVIQSNMLSWPPAHDCAGLRGAKVATLTATNSANNGSFVIRINSYSL
jgi:hypothetical protein